MKQQKLKLDIPSSQEIYNNFVHQKNEIVAIWQQICTEMASYEGINIGNQIVTYHVSEFSSHLHLKPSGIPLTNTNNYFTFIAAINLITAKLKIDNYNNLVISLQQYDSAFIPDKVNFLDADDAIQYIRTVVAFQQFRENHLKQS